MVDVARAKCLILGGGGHCRVIIDALLASETAEHLVIVDHAPERRGADVLGVPVRGNDDDLPMLRAAGYHRFVVGLGGVGDNAPRAALFAKAVAAGLEPMTVVHPSAIVSRFCRIGAGSVVLAGAIVNAGAEIGINVVVNTGAVVEHDAVLGDHVQIAPGARVLGGARIDRLAYVGAGAVVRQNIQVGESAVVGINAAVVKDVPAATVAVGVPASVSPIRKGKAS